MSRGVVRLFNAVAKAQRAQKEAEQGGAKGLQASKLSKASFLAELRSQQSAAAAPAQACRILLAVSCNFLLSRVPV